MRAADAVLAGKEDVLFMAACAARRLTGERTLGHAASRWSVVVVQRIVIAGVVAPTAHALGPLGQPGDEARESTAGDLAPGHEQMSVTVCEPAS